MTEPQTARTVMMLRPACFAANPETAGSNAFQSLDAPMGTSQVQAEALREFESLTQLLTHAGVEVIAFDDTQAPCKPDAVFPNNWISFHADGTVVLYPMLAGNRRLERRPELIDRLSAQYGFEVRRIVDLSGHESRGEFLEGTGSMVLDRIGSVAYACVSPRTHPAALADFTRQLGYEALTFDAHDAGGVAIYHTNVLMCIGQRFAVLCSEAIGADGQRAAVERRLGDTGHELVRISLAQMNHFAGNMLALESQAGESVVAMSATAWGSLDRTQQRTLECYGQIIPAPIPTIERLGGGSVRCMLAEVHLPRRGLPSPPCSVTDA